MKRILYTFFLSGILSSCAFHSGNVSTGPIVDCPMKNIVTGEASTIKLFGIGGLDKKALIIEAKRDLYSKHSNTKTIKLSNFSVDFKTTFIFFYSRTEAIVSADLYDCDTLSLASNDKPVPTIGGLAAGDSIIYEFEGGYKGIFRSHADRGKCMVTLKLPNGKTKDRKVSVSSIYKTSEHPENKIHFGYNLGEEVFIEVYMTKTKTKEIKSCKIVGLNKNRLMISYIKSNGEKRVLSIDKSLVKDN